MANQKAFCLLDNYKMYQQNLQLLHTIPCIFPCKNLKNSVQEKFFHHSRTRHELLLQVYKYNFYERKIGQVFKNDCSWDIKTILE